MYAVCCNFHLASVLRPNFSLNSSSRPWGKVNTLEISSLLTTDLPFSLFGWLLPMMLTNFEILNNNARVTSLTTFLMPQPAKTPVCLYDRLLSLYVRTQKVVENGDDDSGNAAGSWSECAASTCLSYRYFLQFSDLRLHDLPSSPSPSSHSQSSSHPVLPDRL